jgi:hypothetical protein
MRRHDVPVLLMGGQACVLYGAAEYSRDLDLAVLATGDGLTRLRRALDALQASVIAVPPFDAKYLERGHAVHFSVPDAAGISDERGSARDAKGSTIASLRVDVMSRMRNVADFDTLWARRTTIALSDPIRDGTDVEVDVMALEDLVAAKKTQRDKDWPMIRRLVDASYAAARDEELHDEQAVFWLSELRSPAFIAELVARAPSLASGVERTAVVEALRGGDVAAALAVEQAEEMATDRAYWAPLRRELEALRHQARVGGASE